MIIYKKDEVIKDYETYLKYLVNNDLIINENKTVIISKKDVLDENTKKYFEEKGVNIKCKDRLLGANIVINGNNIQSEWEFTGKEGSLLYESKEFPYKLRKLLFESKIYVRWGFHIGESITLEHESTNFRQIYRHMYNLFKYKTNYLDTLLMNMNLIKMIISSSLVKKWYENRK